MDVLYFCEVDGLPVGEGERPAGAGTEHTFTGYQRFLREVWLPSRLDTHPR